jgi:hypothetical protein
MRKNSEEVELTSLPLAIILRSVNFQYLTKYSLAHLNERIFTGNWIYEHVVKF